MQKQSLGLGRLAVMVLFALSCFGLLLYLWVAFGGSAPLKPEGYRVKIAFPEATQLAQQADVRISGVPVGKVVKLDQDGPRTLATIQMKSKYAPLRSNARAILRLKTLLGETYVSLTPGDASAPYLKDNGQLRDTQVQDTTQVDEVLRAFPKKTREETRQFLANWAKTLNGRGEDINDIIGNLGPTATSGASLFDTLNTQKQALSTLVRDTGVTFGALGRQEGATQELIRSGNEVFRTTAQRDQDLEKTLAILPSFLEELKPTLRAIQATAVDAGPTVRALKPVAPLVRPVLRDTIAISPDLKTLFRRLDPVITLSRKALPAGTSTLKAAGPLLGVLDPLARELNPVADFVATYRQEFTQSWMNVAAATNAKASDGATRDLNYLRLTAPLGNEAIYGQSKRPGSNRANAYRAPGAYDKLASGLEAFDCANASNPTPIPILGSGTPACVTQKPPTVNGQTTAFSHINAAPAPDGR